jgi:iron complex transport system ATP-binding protein
MAIEAQNLTVHAGHQTLLHNVQVQLPAQQWTAIVGPNGAGKSTLLRALAGLQPRKSWQGQIQLLGQALHAWPAKARAQALSWMGQNEAVAQDLSSYDVVMLGRMPHQAWLAPPSAHDHAVVQTCLHTTQAWGWRHRPLAQLSGGERQRVLLARALAVQAQVLLMDEPLANLDPPHQSEWMHTVQGLVQQGHTVVSVLHELGIALQSQHMVVMQAGRVLHQGATHDAATHAALEAVFDHRIRIRAIEGMWMALPTLARGA